MYKNREAIVIAPEVKQLGYVVGFFLLTMLLSALFSGDLGKGLKNWGDLWIWRMMPCVIMVLALNEYAKAKRVMLAALLGIIVGFGCTDYQLHSRRMGSVGTGFYYFDAVLWSAK